jgi:YesN/AraC family two-component response regulator
MHSGLYKALKYIANNYEREVTLSELAANVYVSASHLSYLFKHHLRKSFKQILSELRIERAKQRISESPYARITDIFQEVGFGDLSHFEKIFKRYTGVTPREYKKKIQAMQQ